MKYQSLLLLTLLAAIASASVATVIIGPTQYRDNYDAVDDLKVIYLGNDTYMVVAYGIFDASKGAGIYVWYFNNRTLELTPKSFCAGNAPSALVYNNGVVVGTDWDAPLYIIYENGTCTSIDIPLSPSGAVPINSTAVLLLTTDWSDDSTDIYLYNVNTNTYSMIAVCSVRMNVVKLLNVTNTTATLVGVNYDGLVAQVTVDFLRHVCVVDGEYNTGLSYRPSFDVRNGKILLGLSGNVVAEISFVPERSVKLIRCSEGDNMDTSGIAISPDLKFFAVGQPGVHVYDWSGVCRYADNDYDVWNYAVSWDGNVLVGVPEEGGNPMRIYVLNMTALTSSNCYSTSSSWAYNSTTSSSVISSVISSVGDKIEDVLHKIPFVPLPATLIVWLRKRRRS